MFVIDRFQKELFIVIWLLQLDWVDNRNTELFIPIDQEYSLHTSFGRVDEKTPNWGKEAKGSEQVRYLWISKTCSLFPNLKCVILTSAVARFYCLSRDVRSSDWCLEKYNSWAKSFESSCKDPVGLIDTCSWINRAIVSKKKKRLGRMFFWNQFFIWWRNKIFVCLGDIETARFSEEARLDIWFSF